MKRLACILAALAVGLASVPASAEDDTKTRAKAAYAAGEKLAAEADWPKAAQAFAEADAIAPNDVALESALEAAIRADLPLLGMELVDRSTRSASAAAIPAVGKARELFGPRTSALVVRCVTEPTPCDARVDGRRIDVGRVWVSPGKHSVVFVTKDGERTVPLELSPGEAREITPPRATPPAVMAPPPVPPPPPADEGASPWWVALPGGLTLVFGGVLIAGAVETKSAESALADYQVEGRPDDGAPASAYETYEARQRELIDDGEQWATVTNVFIGLTAAAGAATVLVAALGVDWTDGGEAGTTAIVSPVPGGGATVGVAGRF
jgi:hypothetical protein